MSNTTLIIGESGTGKSTSLRNLNPEETYIINILDKPLPFRGYKKHYKASSVENPKGNYFASDDFGMITKCILAIDKRPEVKNLIIDDFQYVMGNEFMRRALEKGFDKFSDIAQHAWTIIRLLTQTRSDLYCFVLSHSDADSQGRMKAKTIGKMLDDKITLEGMFTTILHTQIVDGQYKFLTQNNGTHIAKSPMGMFEDDLIDNDLQIVREKMISYCDEDIES
jgi:hypothetical protein